MAKFIFVTGGVVSGLGKGITAASLGRLLKCRGLKVASQKLDPYVNVDPGTMSPLQHGEVFVTDDGTETDLDLGHYERFIDENLNKYSNLTTGKVYWNVLNKERQGAYLGQTVQIIPHITNEIKSYIYNLASSTEADVVITEIGGTTGDIESQPFLEAIRQVGLEQGRENCCYIHVVLVPYISGSDEYKSKPAQHSVKELQGMGVSPDIIILRADGSVGSDIRRKISTFCNVKPECVIENLTMPSLYQCPLMLHTNGLDDVVVHQLHLDVPPADLTEWKQVVSRIATRSKTCTIALVGKYVKLHDAYLSVMESLYHAGFENDSQVEIRWVESEDLTDQAACKEAFADVDGIIVPGGFGDRGIEGMILAAQYAREHGIPYLGICLGMQIAVIEFARHALGWDDATSAEFSSTTAHPVIALMPEQVGVTAKGGTMRLGKYPCVLEEGSLSRALYDAPEIWERHRHRYEFNNDFRDDFTDADMRLAGADSMPEVRDRPALRDVEAEQLRQLRRLFARHGVLPGAERHQQFAGLVECEVTVHHGGEADVADVRELLAIGGLDVVGQGGVSGLQTAPDLLGGVAPQTIFQMGSPAVVAGGDGLEVVVDEDGLDAGGAEFDAQRGLASANLLGDVGDLLGRVVGCCHIFPLPWSAGVVIPFLGEGVSAHNFQKTLYRQPAFDTTYAVSRIITV